uniref:Serine/threonine protein kinase n=1 Tax=Strongyloides venezuelensis TaxID=75913 RepID=A0A0K0FZ09_STRVS
MERWYQNYCFKKDLLLRDKQLSSWLSFPSSLLPSSFDWWWLESSSILSIPSLLKLSLSKRITHQVPSISLFSYFSTTTTYENSDCKEKKNYSLQQVVSPFCQWTTSNRHIKKYCIQSSNTNTIKPSLKCGKLNGNLKWEKQYLMNIGTINGMEVKRKSYINGNLLKKTKYYLTLNRGMGSFKRLARKNLIKKKRRAKKSLVQLLYILLKKKELTKDLKKCSDYQLQVPDDSCRRRHEFMPLGNSCLSQILKPKRKILVTKRCTGKKRLYLKRGDHFIDINRSNIFFINNIMKKKRKCIDKGYNLKTNVVKLNQTNLNDDEQKNIYKHKERIKRNTFISDTIGKKFLIYYLWFISLFQLVGGNCLLGEQKYDNGCQINGNLHLKGEDIFIRNKRIDKDQKMCHIWNHFSPKDLCSKRPFDRLDLLREISLFTADCPSSSANVHLSELFRLDWSRIKSSHDLLSATEHLKNGEDGKDCLLGGIDSTKCLKCFHNIGTKLEKIIHAYNIFNKTLHRFDCMLAVDSASATRPFSPNGTCVNCKIWYRKWLLVQLMDIWIEPICINWCYYAQLACPHFATSKSVDYAGHPTFQCRDTNIPISNNYQFKNSGDFKYKDDDSTISLSCNCLHPCDFYRDLNYLNPLNDEEIKHLKNSNLDHHDVFWDINFCKLRKFKCNERKKKNVYLTGKIKKLVKTKDGTISKMAKQKNNTKLLTNILQTSSSSFHSLNSTQLICLSLNFYFFIIFHQIII